MVELFLSSMSGNVCLDDWDVIIRRQITLILVGYMEHFLSISFSYGSSSIIYIL